MSRSQDRHVLVRYAVLIGLLLCNISITPAQVYVDIDATGANDGTSWANAFNSLRQALFDTNAGEIWVAEGVYHPCEPIWCNISPEFVHYSLKENVAIYGGFSGSETQLSQRDFVAHETILSGELGDPGDATDNSRIIVDAFEVGPSAVLDGFIIEKGYATGFAGSGLHVYGASPTILNCIFRENQGLYSGAVLVYSYSNASPIFLNCSFIHNTVQNGSNGGGGMYFLVTLNSTCTATITDCLFLNNFSLDDGGAVSITVGSGVSGIIFDDCQFSANSSNGGGFVLNGGAVSMQTYNNGTNNTEFHACAFDNNHIDVGYGGAVASRNEGGNDSPIFDACTFSGNTAPWFGSSGGALYIVSSLPASHGSPTISDCTIEGSSAVQTGGGLYLASFSGAAMSPVISNTTISGNSANTGGGITCYGYDAGSVVNLTLDQCNVDGNISNSTFNGSGGAGIIFTNNGQAGTQTNVTILGGSVSGNTSMGSGGGIQYFGQFGATSANTLEISGCTIDGNSAQYIGGGIDMRAGGGPVSLILSDCTVSNNTAGGDYGGGMYLNNYFSGSIAADIDNCIFDGNSCGTGGGGALVSHAFGGGSFMIDVDASTFTSNTAALQGGAMFFYNTSAPGSSQVSVTNSMFQSNSAGNSGGAIYDQSTGFNGANTGYYSNCVFGGNVASGNAGTDPGKGGALYIRGSENGSNNVTIVNGLFYNNSSSVRGGAVYATGNVTSAGTCASTIANSTFSGNASPLGNALHLNSGTSSIANAIFWDGGSEIGETGGASTTLTNCILQNGYAGSGSSTNILTQDPLFVDPGSDDYHLTPCSPAVNVGDNTGIPTDGGDVDNDGNTAEQVAIDLDGNARIVNAVVDLGAYEFDGSVQALAIAIDSTPVSCAGMCDGVATVDVMNGTPGYAYSWSTGSSGQSVTGLCPGTYFVTVTDNGQCVRMDSVVLDAPIAIDLMVSADTSVCAGQTVMLTANATGGSGGFSYLWNQGIGSGPMHAVTPVTSTTYMVTVSDAVACSQVSDVQVTVFDQPGVFISGDTSLCDSEQTTLDAGGFSSYIWSNSATTQMIDVGSAGLYAVTVTDGNGCSGTDAVTVLLNSNPTPLITGDTSICENGTSTIDAGVYESYAWSNGGTTQSVSVNAPGGVFVTVTDVHGCMGTDAVLILQNPNPTPIISGDTSLCVGESSILNAGMFTSYNWSGGEITQMIPVSMPGVVTVTVTDENGCEGTDNIEVIQFADVIPDITGALSYCEGFSTSLDAGAFIVYDWSTGATSQTITVSTPDEYSVTVTDINGCTGEDAVDVIEFVVAPDITGQLSFCTGDMTTLSVGTYMTYSWSTGETTQSIQVTSGGTVGVTVTDENGCEGTDMVTIVENDSLLPQIDGDEIVCQGESSVLDAGIFDGYNWSTGETTQQIVISTADTYAVTVSDDNGCTGEDAFVVTVVDNPSVDIAGSTVFCAGESTVLSTGVFIAYEWSTGEQSQSIEVFQDGIIGLTVTDENGCTASTEVIIDETPLPEPEVDGDFFLCEGASALLIASTHSSYVWSTGEITQSITVASPGNYGLTVSDDTGCTGVIEFEVFQLGAPEVSISGSTTFCTGGQTTLSAGNFESFHWSNGEDTQSIVVGEEGIYTVTVTDINGCTGTDEVIVSEAPGLSTEIIGATTACAGDSIELDAGIFDHYAWSTGETAASISVAQSGMYDVTVSDNAGCSGSAAITIQFFDAPEPQIIGESQICSGDSALLDVGAFNAYGWSTGESSQIIIVNSSGVYDVTVTDANGCTAVAQHEIDILMSPSPVITGDDQICEGATAILDAGNFASYVWVSGATSQSISVDTAGVYIVTVTDINGCTGSAGFVLEVINELSPNISGQLSICTGSSTQLSVSPFEHIQWSTGDTTLTIEVVSSGMYSVTVTNASGCSGSAVAEVSVSDQLMPEITGDLVLCSGGTGMLSTAAFDHFTWSTGDTTQQISINTPGTYLITVSDDSGCSGTTQIEVTSGSIQQPVILGDLEFCDGLTSLLSVQDYDSYAWSSGEIAQSISVSASGLYSVTVSNTQGCTDSASVIVTVYPEVNADIAGLLTICEGSSTILDAGSFDMYQWSTGDTTQSVLVDTAGIVSVTVTNSNGCTGVAMTVVEVGDALDAVILGDLNICTGTSTTLSTGLFDGYTWSTGDTSQVILVSEAGSYSVTVSDLQGCTGVAEADVIINDIADAEITGNLNICTGSTTLLDAGDHDAYQWSTGAQNQSISVSGSGVYSVTVTDSGGCTGVASVEVEVSDELMPMIFGPSSVCTGASANLEVGVYFSYLWSTGAMTQSIAVNNAGTYMVTVTDAGGCTGTDAIVVAVSDELEVEISGDTILCDGLEAELSTGFSGTHIWSTGDTTANLNIETPGIYTVTVTESGGCSGEAEILISQGEEAQAVLTIDVTDICAGDSILLLSSGTGLLSVSGTFVPDEIGNGVFSIIPQGNGSMQLISSTICGTDTATVQITVHNAPDVSAGDDVLVQSFQDEVQLHGSGALSFSWSPGSLLSCTDCADPFVTLEETQTFVVEGTDADGCKGIDSVTVFILIDLQLNPVNVITPNGDGINDRFYVEGIEFFPNSSLTVFNRWGEPVYETSAYENDWEGTYKGELLPAGSYLYQLRVSALGQLHVYKGTVTIVR